MSARSPTGVCLVNEGGIDVVVQLAGQDELAGKWYPHRRRGVESSTFGYAESYLATPGAYELDPRLRLFTGQQQTAPGEKIFGAFADTTPDRWGRRLILRNENGQAKIEGRTPRSFGEADFVLGVRDDLRQGALRFRKPGSENYLAGEIAGVPHLLQLPQVLESVNRLDLDQESGDDLRLLLRAGSSLGGARPKAHVVDQDGDLAIAKFPSAVKDEWDVMAWEATALSLAEKAGLTVPVHQLHRLDGSSVLVIKRFDRSARRRFGYRSAMTVLEARDGDQRSYLEIAEAIELTSPSAGADLVELWRRMVFNVLISNTDDHLRNHGFLRADRSGWTLSPVFDLNPNPAPGTKFLSTAIDVDDTTASIEALMLVASYFRLSAATAGSVLGSVLEATDRWREIARGYNISEGELQRMESAFEHPQREEARKVARR